MSSLESETDGVSMPQFNRQIAKFNTLAKLTHAKYGTINVPASLDTWKKANVVATIANGLAVQNTRRGTMAISVPQSCIHRVARSLRPSTQLFHRSGCREAFRV